MSFYSKVCFTILSDLANKGSCMHIFMKKEDAIKRFESSTKIANAIGITKQAVSGWGLWVPEGSALKLLRIDPSIPHTQNETANT